MADDPSLKVATDVMIQDISLDWANRIIRHLEQAIKDHQLNSFFEPAKNLLLFEGSGVMYNVEQYRALVSCLQELFAVGTS